MHAIRLAEVTRGPLVESVHRGVYVVVDNQGNLIASGGDAGYITYMRSAAKPMQALPVLESGAAEQFGLTAQEIAVLTSSHSGEAVHRELVASLLKKVEIDISCLQCGSHTPVHGPTAKELAKQQSEPDALHNVCSGKHAGMLLLCRFKGWPTDNYFAVDHPVQLLMHQTIAEMAEMDADKIVIGVDGCGVPVFGLPVYAMAYAYARFARPDIFPQARRDACVKIAGAMMRYPQAVAGTGRFCTDLMEAADGKIIAKDGVEGVFCMGIPEKGWGVAVKVEDGNMRAVAPVVVNLLEKLAVLSKDELQKLEKYRAPKLRNHRQEIIGEIRGAIEI